MEIILIVPIPSSLWDATIAFSHFTLEMSPWILLYMLTSGTSFLVGPITHQLDQLFT